MGYKIRIRSLPPCGKNAPLPGHDGCMLPPQGGRAVSYCENFLPLAEGGRAGERHPRSRLKDAELAALHGSVGRSRAAGEIPSICSPAAGSGRVSFLRGKKPLCPAVDACKAPSSPGRHGPAAVLRALLRQKGFLPPQAPSSFSNACCLRGKSGSRNIL